MNNKKRILWAILILMGISGFVLVAEYFRGLVLLQPAGIPDEFSPGSVPIYLNGNFVASFSAENFKNLHQRNFVDAEEGKTQTGWTLADILPLYLPEQAFMADTRIVIVSSSRNKKVEITWRDAANPDYLIMFTLSGRGTLKLTSRMPGLDTRNDWIQDTDKVEVLVP